MSEYKRPTFVSLLSNSRRLRCWRAARQQLLDPATLADAKLESTPTNENNKKLHYLIADLNSHRDVKLALPCELTRQNRYVHAVLPGRRTTTRSPTVRLNSKLTIISNRKDQATVYLAEQLLLDFERKVGQRRYGQGKKFEETTKVTCW